MTKVFCDRCEKEIADGESQLPIGHKESGQWFVEGYVCTFCIASFRTWWKNAKDGENYVKK